MDAASFALLWPIVERAMKERQNDAKKNGLMIIGAAVLLIAEGVGNKLPMHPLEGRRRKRRVVRLNGLELAVCRVVRAPPEPRVCDPAPHTLGLKPRTGELLGVLGVLGILSILGILLYTVVYLVY